MDILEIEQHRLVLKRAKSLIKVAFNSDKEYLKNIISNSKGIIDNFNKENLTVLDVTEKENSNFSKALKFIVRSEFLNYILKKLEKSRIDYNDEYVFCESHFKYYPEYKEFLFNVDDLCCECKKENERQEKEYHSYFEEKKFIESEFMDSCRKSVFDEDLKLKWILFNRLINENQNILYKSLKEAIRTEMISVYYNQNKELITKYL